MPDDTPPDAPVPMVMRISGLAAGLPSFLDGQWIVEYDPTRPGVGPNGEPLTAHIVWSADRDQARRFADAAAAHAYWIAKSPNAGRPLTAYHVLIEEA